MSYQSKVADSLNDLIEINRDRIKGYEKAVEEAGANTVVANVFRRNVEQSQGFLSELTQSVTQLGGEAEKSGTVLGAIHRAWMDIKNAVSVHEKESALENCKFGDSAALKAYESVLNDTDNPLPSDVREVVQDQYNRLNISYTAVNAMESIAEKINA